MCTRYHFATLFDTNQRIAVYSAYFFQPSNGGGREKRWFVEPQVGETFFCFYAPHICAVATFPLHLGFSLNSKKCCCDSQLVNMTWQAGMKDGYWLGKDHPGVYLGEKQALNEDYTHSGFDRGHLNPNGHHPGSF